MSDNKEKFEFEIICPFCDKEFVAEIDLQSVVKCPECNNLIELSWNSEEENGCCSGHCSSCHNRCGGDC